MFGNIKEQIACHYEYAAKVNNIAKLSETRWAVRVICFKRILDNYAALSNLWQPTLHNDNLQTDVKSRIIGIHYKTEIFLFFL